MRKIAFLLLGLTFVVTACSSEPPPEPERIRVQHLLIGFQGSMGTYKELKRSRAEAETLAKELLQRAQGGEDFDALVRQYSDEKIPGIYALLNDGAPLMPETLPRRVLAAGFGDLAFRLKVGEIGMVNQDPQAMPTGWEIIKRLE